MISVFDAHLPSSSATAATPRSTKAYSATACPCSLRRASANTKRVWTATTRVSMNVSSSWSAWSEAQRPQGVGEERRHRQQREGGEDAEHQGEEQQDRHPSGRLFHAATLGVASFGG